MLSELVGATTGWGDLDEATLAVYLRELQSYDDMEAARQAIDNVIKSWTRPSRPPVGVLNQEYRQAMARLMMDRNVYELPTGRIPTVAEGRKIAARAYVQECKRLGKKPNMKMFNRIIGQIGPNA